METKTYKANTMIEALQMVQGDLGSDAVVLSAREVPAGPAWGKWKRTAVEVVAAPAQSYQKKTASPSKSPLLLTDDPAEIEWVKETTSSLGKAPVNAEKKAPVWQPIHMSREAALNSTRNTTQSHQQPVTKVVDKPQPPTPSDAISSGLPSGLSKNRQALLAQGVEEAFLNRTMKLLTSTMNGSALYDENNARKYLFQILEAELRTISGIQNNPPGRVLFLVGPSGSGKTSLTAKIAAYYSQKGKRVSWVCADTVRTGAIYQGRAYADALGLAFKLAYTPDELRDSAVNDSESDLILIDTPGYNPLDENQMVELGSFLTELPNRQTFLTVPATAKEADTAQAASVLGMFGVDGMMVTKLDETTTFGSVYNFARKSRLPMGFFSSGKDATSQFQLANTTRLVAAVFGKGWMK